MAHADVLWIAVVGLAACGPQVVQEVGDASGSSGGAPNTSEGPLPQTSTSSTSAGTTVATTIGPDPTTSSSTTQSPDSGASFIIDFDFGEPWDCDIFAQDCPAGQKCMPWANDGGASWNATRCSDVVADPREIGESCTAVDSRVSGIDDCTFGAMCFFVDGATGIGQCVGFCTGTLDAPTCGDACTTCSLGSADVLALCLPSCDPLAQDCDAGEGCYSAGTGFTCVSDQSGQAGAAGDPCSFINECDPGLVCSSADDVPGCAGDGCCAPVCDTSAADTCDASLPGTTCLPWDGALPEGCVIPVLGVCGG